MAATETVGALKSAKNEATALKPNPNVSDQTKIVGALKSAKNEATTLKPNPNVSDQTKIVGALTSAKNEATALKPNSNVSDQTEIVGALKSAKNEATTLKPNSNVSDQTKTVGALTSANNEATALKPNSNVSYQTKIVGALTSAKNEATKLKSNKTPPGHKALRKGRLSIPGQAYFLTTTTLFRRPVFNDFDAARAAASVHDIKWVWRDSQVLAWVLMPDHWHGLIVLGQNDELHKLIGRFKTASAKLLEDRYKINGYVWSRGYHDHALRTDEGLRDTGRYIVANPLRAGIVKDIGMYPFWNAVWLDPKDQASVWS